VGSRKEQRVERRLAAIFAADVAGYSRLMSQDEVGTLRALTAAREILDGSIGEHGGRIANTPGDSVLAEFPSAVDAVQCAVAVQERLGQVAADAPEDRRLHFRIGIHLGDVAIRGGDLLGDGVNIAARLEGLTKPGGVCVSESVYAFVRKALPLAYTDLGEQVVKGFDEPVRAFAVRPTPAAAAATPQSKPLPLPDRPSIAVLPFTNMSGDPEQEYFADGVVEDIITALSRFKWLFVIARNSSFTYKGRAVDVKQVGRELGVRYVLEGSIRKASQRVRITGQLIDAATGNHLWVDRFDGALDDIFQLQDDVSASVANAVAPKMEQVETERAKRKPLQHLGAYDLLLRARAVYQGNSWRPAGGLADIEKAHHLLLQALELDPEFGPAYAAAASSFSVRKANQWVVDQAREVEATDRFARAVGRFAADDPAALCMAGSALAHVVRDIEAGTRYTDRALALAPNLAIANLYGALVCMWRGDAELAIARLTRAMRLSPLDPMLFAMQDIMALAHFQASRYAEAVFWAEASLADQPNDPIASRILAASHALTGEVQQAQRALKKLLHLVPTLRISNLRDILGPYPPEVMARQEHGLRLAGLPE
jgi:TolB-like protein/class 3 adenylate cyclase